MASNYGRTILRPVILFELPRNVTKLRFSTWLAATVKSITGNTPLLNKTQIWGKLPVYFCIYEYVNLIHFTLFNIFFIVIEDL